VRNCFSFMLVLLSGIVVAAEMKLPTKEEIAKMTPEQRKAQIMAIAHRKYGGQVTKPNTGKGIVKIVNSQNEIKTDAVKKLVETFAARFHYNIEVSDGASVSVSTAKAETAKIGASVAIYIVADESLPRILVSPEDGWVIINAKALTVGKASQEEAEGRLAKESLRALYFLGGMGQAAGIPIMQPVNYAIDLDTISNTTIMGDALKRFALVFPKFGLEPKVVKNYRVAMEEGWAPKPVDEDQQAIWDEFNKKPSKPMTIKFDPKKGE